jgi:hypothetical protein
MQLWDLGTGELAEQIVYNAGLNAQKECMIYGAQF